MDQWINGSIDQFGGNLNASFIWNKALESRMKNILSEFQTLCQQFNGIYQNPKSYQDKKRLDQAYIDELAQRIVWVNGLKKCAQLRRRRSENCMNPPMRYLIVAIIAIAVYKYNYPCEK